jgi:hypothetical protein
MSIYEKMFNVMNESEALEKNMTVGKGENSYKAVSEAAMLNMVKPLFKRHRLIIFPIDGTITETNQIWESESYGKKETKTRNVSQLKVMYRIFDIDTNEHQDVVGFGNGADPQDKGAGKASTYSLKNALSKTFMLFSGEDTDNEHSDDIGAEKPKKDTVKDLPKAETKPTAEYLAAKRKETEAMLEKAVISSTQVAEIFKIIKSKFNESNWQAEYTRITGFKGVKEIPSAQYETVRNKLLEAPFNK